MVTENRCHISPLGFFRAKLWGSGGGDICKFVLANRVARDNPFLTVLVGAFFYSRFLLG